MRCWGVWPLELLGRGLARLPNSWLWALSAPLSVLLTPLMRRRRRIAAINLALCFPELTPAARARLLRANQRSTVMGVFELLQAWYAPPKVLAGLASIEGLPLLLQAFKDGQGVLLMTGHFAQTELAVRLLSEALPRKLRVIVRRHNSPCVEAAFERARSRIAGPTLAKKDMRGLLRCLQAGEAVIYSADQNFSYQHAFVPFFGVAAATLASTPALVKRSGARMIGFWFHRGEDGRYYLRLEPAWPGWMEGTPEQAAAIYMRQLEAVVRPHPEQYLWMHRRFKTRPPGEPPLY